MADDSPIEDPIPGSFTLPQTEKELQYTEYFGYTFHLFKTDATSKSNEAYFDAKLPPVQVINLQLKADLPADATKIWDGQIYVSGALTDVNVYRLKA